MTIKLSDRLRQIASFIEPGESVCDIGTDHGFLPIFLVQQGGHDPVIMSDVSSGSLDKAVAEPAFINVNDGTNEGLSYVGKNIFTVQFHPEACPGPQDSSYLFDRFISMIKEGGKA